MVSKYQAYSEYTKSEVDWVEELPKHWELSKLRYTFTFRKGLTITKENLSDEGVPCVNYGEVHSKYGFEVDPKIHHLKCVSEEYLKSSPSALLTKGDLVFADTSEDIEGSGNFTQLISDESIFAGYHTIIAQPDERQCSRFYAYLLDSVELRTQIRHAVKGVKVFSVTQAILRGIDIWLPPFKEREKIANFLDHETAKIDTLIEKQQQLIKLLKEKRQAVISHAVTKGLNPDVPMRDSGVEWLGEVPEHWSVKKFSHCATIRNGQVDPTREPYCDFILVAPNHIESGTGRLLAQETATEQGADSGKYLCKEGEVIYSKIRPALAKVCISPSDEVICSADMYPIQGISGLTNEFLFWSLLSTWFTSLVILESDRVAMPKINREKLAEVILPIPPESEQQQIGKEIRKKTKATDYLIQKTKRAISLAQERRTALVSAAVTGKIDVRDWQQPKSSNCSHKKATV